MLGFPRGQDPCSIKLYQSSILLDDWKHEFCFGSGRAIFSGRTDVEDEAPKLAPSDVNSQFIGRDPDAGKYCRQRIENKGMRWCDGISESVDMSLRKLHKIV